MARKTYLNIKEISTKVKNTDGTTEWKTYKLAVNDVKYNNVSVVDNNGVAKINDTFTSGTTTKVSVGSLASGTDIGGKTPLEVLKLILGVS